MATMAAHDVAGTSSADRSARRAPRQRRFRPMALAAVAALAVVAGACSSGSSGSSTAAGGVASTGIATTAAGGSTGGTAGGPKTASAGVNTPARPSPACASPGAPGAVGATATITKGEPTDEALSSSGVARTYKRFVPSSYDGAKPLPVVVDIHGYMEGSAVHTAMSNLNAAAEKKGFVNLTPQGTGSIPYWNAGPVADGPDDVRYVSDLIDATGQKLCVDLNRVYVTGLSNGAFMTSLVACRLADKVAAAAPVAGLMMPKDCNPSRPVPIVAFHGKVDPFVSYESNQAGPAAQTLNFNDETLKAFAAVNFQPIPTALQQWSSLEGCRPDATDEKVTASVTLKRYEGCRDGSVVELYVVADGGHSWPGSQFSASIERVVGKTTFEIDANELMWAFFEQHPLPG